MVTEPHSCCFAATIIPRGKRSFLRCKPIEAEASFIAAALQPRPAGAPRNVKALQFRPRTTRLAGGGTARPAGTEQAQGAEGQSSLRPDRVPSSLTAVPPPEPSGTGPRPGHGRPALGGTGDRGRAGAAPRTHWAAPGAAPAHWPRRPPVRAPAPAGPTCASSAPTAAATSPARLRATAAPGGRGCAGLAAGTGGQTSEGASAERPSPPPPPRLLPGQL